MYSNKTLLVPSGTSIDSINAILAFNWWCLCSPSFLCVWGGGGVGGIMLIRTLHCLVEPFQYLWYSSAHVYIDHNIHYHFIQHMASCHKHGLHCLFESSNTCNIQLHIFISHNINLSHFIQHITICNKQGPTFRQKCFRIKAEHWSSFSCTWTRTEPNIHYDEIKERIVNTIDYTLYLLCVVVIGNGLISSVCWDCTLKPM